MHFFSESELQELVTSGLADAEKELSDNGKELTVECDFKNGDHGIVKDYNIEIDSGEYSLTNAARHDRLKKIVGMIA